MAKILYGAEVKKKIKEDLVERIKKLGRQPILAILQVGDREDSNIYIKQKIKFGEEIGVKVLPHKFFEISEDELEKEIKKLNEEKQIDGIILQLPLSPSFDSEKILNTINIKKDTDGLSAHSKNCGVVPATARGVMELLDFYEIPIKNKKVAVIGQSNLAGKPIALELEKRGAEVFRCDINTKNIPEIARECEILVSATGQINLIDKNFVNENQTVIDVGINRSYPEKLLSQKFSGLLVAQARLLSRTFLNSSQKPKLVGDVNFEEVSKIVFAITPVPGGVGLLTVASLFQNLIDLCYNEDN